ncbi:hypothetical protein [Litoreibacter arenae]|uniref:Uncharacterized protein n=1 Tax=Litoreibacter arenae DSM 19593 TaxID=1123360 RepID=S9QH96_9RHOB|nr:hypothetical protein [Litoreibacter arenae]EPX80841.1 hypothetical protein thalar_01063 [Litoreibacter arenae DSM 19593]
MKLLTLTTALALAAAPVLAGSPAEEFGLIHAGNGASAAAQATAIEKLSGDDTDSRIVVIENAQVSRNSQGHQQLARDLGVSADAYSTAELAHMFIKAHD